MAARRSTRSKAITEDKAEQAALEKDRKALESASGGGVKMPELARDYVKAVHPDTGLDVVFVPGEALPSWAMSKAEDEVGAGDAAGVVDDD